MGLHPRLNIRRRFAAFASINYSHFRSNSDTLPPPRGGTCSPSSARASDTSAGRPRSSSRGTDWRRCEPASERLTTNSGIHGGWSPVGDLNRVADAATGVAPADWESRCVTGGAELAAAVPAAGCAAGLFITGPAAVPASRCANVPAGDAGGRSPQRSLSSHASNPAAAGCEFAAPIAPGCAAPESRAGATSLRAVVLFVSYRLPIVAGCARAEPPSQPISQPSLAGVAAVAPRGLLNWWTVDSLVGGYRRREAWPASACR